MFGIFLSLLGIVLFESGNTALFISENPFNWRYEIRLVNKAINWISVFCWGCLPVVGSRVLAEIECASFILCNVLRVQLAVYDRDCVRVSFYTFCRICDQFDTFICYKEVLFDCPGWVRSGAKNCPLKGRSIEESRIDVTLLCIPNRRINKV